MIVTKGFYYAMLLFLKIFPSICTNSEYFLKDINGCTSFTINSHIKIFSDSDEYYIKPLFSYNDDQYSDCRKLLNAEEDEKVSFFYPSSI